MKGDEVHRRNGFSAQYIEENGKHKWIMNPAYFDGEPILSIKPINGLCRHKNVIICPLYRKHKNNSGNQGISYENKIY